MSDVTISVRIDEQIHEKMKEHDEVNWSAIVRKSISEYVERIEEFDKDRAKKALNSIDQMRKEKIFDQGKNSTEIIKEWRMKRK